MTTKSLTVVLDKDLYFAVKSAAPAAGKTMQQWIADAFKAALPNGKRAIK